MGYFSFQPIMHDWCNKSCSMCYPVCGMIHIKEPLLLIGKSMPCSGSGFPLSLSEWSFTICLTPYNRKQNVLSASLNKSFSSFLIKIYFKIYLKHLLCLQETKGVCVSTLGPTNDFPAFFSPISHYKSPHQLESVEAAAKMICKYWLKYLILATNSSGSLLMLFFIFILSF